jgi:hypothetical protein
MFLLHLDIDIEPYGFGRPWFHPARTIIAWINRKQEGLEEGILWSEKLEE